MAYIGQQPVVGRYILLDQISGGFNGTTSGFTMSTAGGVQGVKPGLAQNVLLSLGGVIQQPGVDYTISGSGITFTTPPVAGTTFFATVLGDAQSVGTPSDGTVTPASIAAGYDFAFPNVNVTGVTTIASGSAATPSLSITGDADTGLFSSAANTVAVTTSGVQRLSIDGAGNVGIAALGQQAAYTDYAKAIVFGTSSETTVGLVLRTGTSGTSSIAFADNSGSGSGAQDGLIEYSQTNRALAFSTATSERMRIDSSGRLLIGTTSGTDTFQVEGSAGVASIIGNRTDALGPRLSLGKSRGSSAGSTTIVQSGDEIGQIMFKGADGTDVSSTGAAIIGLVNGTPGTNDMPGALTFLTTSDGNNSPTERLRIDRSGQVGIGTTSPGQLLHLSSASPRILLTQTSASSNAFLDAATSGVLEFSADDNDVAASSSMRFKVDGSEHLRIDSSGNLGIGTTSPEDSLHIKSNSGAIRLENTVVSNNDSTIAYDNTDLAFHVDPNNVRGSSNITFSGDGNERMRIDSSGRVGIGSSSPSGTLQLQSSTTKIVLTPNGTDKAVIHDSNRGDLILAADEDNTNGASSITFKVDGSDRARVDTNGRLLVGTTSSRAVGQSTAGLLQVETTGAAAVGSITRNSNDGSGPVLAFGKSRGTSNSSNTVVQSGDNLGLIYFAGADGTDSQTVAGRIQCQVDGTPGSNDMPGRLIFSTTADGASSPTERMRIDSSGNVTIGTGSLASNVRLRIKAENSYQSILQFSDQDDDNVGQIAYNHNDNTLAVNVNDSERLRVDGGGRLLVGTTTEINTSSGHLIQSAHSTGAEIVLGRSSTSIAADVTLGALHAFSYAGSTWQESANIKILSDGTHAAGDKPGRIAFSTTADGASSPTERMRIDSSGQVGIGESSPNTQLVVKDASNALNDSVGNINVISSDSAALDKGGSIGLGGFYNGTSNSIPFANIHGKKENSTDNNAAGYFAIATRNASTGTGERMRIDSTGRVGIGATPSDFDGNGDNLVISSSTHTGLTIDATSSTNSSLHFADGPTGNEAYRGYIVYSHSDDSMRIATAATERMRMHSTGHITIGKTTTAFGDQGIILRDNGESFFTKSGTPIYINRENSDGNLIQFYQDENIEGSISVSGSTVSYNGGHLTRWSQLADGAARTEILRGSVLSNLDEMCEWGEEDNEQLNRMKVSDVEGDVNVSGVFQAWDDDDDTYTNDFYCAMTGDFVIRIAQGTTVARGDLLMSAGDGTAKPQDDDIVRSKTIAKVTSTTVSTTYADGSYCVPCVLMAC